MENEFTLTDEFIQSHKYGSDRDWVHVPHLREVADYTGGDSARIAATQLDFHEVNGIQQLYTDSEKRRIVKDWCSFLSTNQTFFRRLYFRSRVPQELFEAACQQTNLEVLHIKWGPYRDLSALRNLKKLRVLYIGSGASVTSIEPLGELDTLRALQIENFQKIEDYAALGRLTKLEMLEIFPAALQTIHLSNLDFLKSLTSLRRLWIPAVIRDGSNPPELG